MLIERIDVYWARVPLAFVWKTSYGDQRFTDTVLVRMEGEGHHAWGESCPPYIPNYSAEHTLATFHTVREHLAPRVIGQDVGSAEDLLRRLDFVKGNQFARAALEITWWVLDATRRGMPLHVALGGKGDAVAVGADFGIQDSLDILMRKIQAAVEAGFPRIKLKFRPGWDVDMVAAVRSTFPDFTFHIDCNAAYTPADTAMFRALDRYRLAMIEQPLADDGLSLVNHADLQAQLETPICLDESALSLAHVQAAIRLKSCKVVNIKMARVGGLTASRAIQALCAQHDIPCWVGGWRPPSAAPSAPSWPRCRTSPTPATSSRRRTSTTTTSASPSLPSPAGRSPPRACPASRRRRIPTCSSSGRWSVRRFARRRVAPTGSGRRP